MIKFVVPIGLIVKIYAKQCKFFAKVQGNLPFLHLMNNDILTIELT